MTRVYNFGSGPSALPKAVLSQIRAELMEWRDSGMSVLEMSHRSRAFSAIKAAVEVDLRELMGIPDNYHVLFLQGGASMQFNMVPINLLAGKRCASFVDTGTWSQKAIQAAKMFCQPHVVASAESSHYRHIPDQATWQVDPDAAYLHYTANETIDGVEFQWIPDADDMPLVSDMSSNILSRPVDVSRFGLIYAGAQKNIGLAGLTIVIVRDNLIGKVQPDPPGLLNYRELSEAHSMLNTPPTFAIYVAGLVLEWIKAQGGVSEMEKRNIKKAGLLYEAIDQSDLYRNDVAVDDRSRMNVPFILTQERLQTCFIEEAARQGLFELKGHRTRGGMRASIYNAMPVEGVRTLIDFMKDFEKTRI